MNWQLGNPGPGRPARQAVRVITTMEISDDPRAVCVCQYVTAAAGPGPWPSRSESATQQRLAANSVAQASAGHLGSGRAQGPTGHTQTAGHDAHQDHDTVMDSMVTITPVVHHAVAAATRAL